MAHWEHTEQGQIFDPEKFRVAIDEIERANPLLTGFDNWLDHRGHTPEAYEIITEILYFVREAAQADEQS